MLNCLMYKLIYYRFGQMRTRGDQESGFDLTRNTVIGVKDFNLKYFEEAYTSERWLVRIYRVKEPEEMYALKSSRHDMAAMNVPVVSMPKMRKMPVF